MFHISDCKVVDLLRRRSFMYSFFCSGRLMTMVMMMMTMMTTTTMNRMSAVSCPVFLGEYSSTPHQVLVVWVFFCGSCLPELSIRWKFSGVCEKYEGRMFVEDEQRWSCDDKTRVGENEEVQQQPVVLYLTYLSIPEVCKQAQVWQSCIPDVFRACLPTCAYLLPYLLLR